MAVFTAKLEHLDIRQPAVAASFILSLLIIAANPIPNDDAFSYLKAAELFSSEGLDATLTSYGWYGYSVLIATLDRIFPGGLITSAHLFNMFAFALLVYAFITLATEYSSSPRVPWFAAAVILCYPTLNEMRFNLIRDFAYWGFCLTALVQLIRYNRTGAIVHAVGWLAAMAAAIFFRLEGLLILAISPFALLLPGVRAMKSRYRHAVILYLLIITGALGILLVFLPAGINLVEVINFAWRWYLPLLADYPGTIAGAASNEYLSYRVSDQFAFFTGKGLFILFIGYLYTVIANLVMATGPAATLFLIYGSMSGKQSLPAECRAPWGFFLAGALLALLIFVSIMQFLTTRYAVMAALVLLSVMPLCIDNLYRQAEQAGSLKTFRAVFGACVFYFLVDSLVSFGYSKRYIEEAIAWSGENIAPGSTLATNNFAVAYYTGLVADYDKVNTDPLTVLANAADSDYVVLDLAHDNEAARTAVSQQGGLQELARFANERGDAIIVFQVE